MNVRKSHLVGTGLATALVLITVGLASAGPGKRGAGPRPDGPGFCDRQAERLELTDEQQQKWEALREKGREEMASVHKSLQRLEHELEGVWLADDPDAGEARGLIEKIGEARTRLRIHRMEQRLAFRELLTTEQRDRMLLGGRRGMMERFGGGRSGRGHGPCDAAHGHGGRRGPCRLDCRRSPESTPGAGRP
jgi:Spy/CpxP family protein refolding chaperone